MNFFLLENETVDKKLNQGEAVRVRIRNRHNQQYLFAAGSGSRVYTTKTAQNIWKIEPIITPGIKIQFCPPVRIKKWGSEQHLYAESTINFFAVRRDVLTAVGDPSGSDWKKKGDWILEQSDRHNSYRILNDYFKEHMYPNTDNWWGGNEKDREVYTYKREDGDTLWDHYQEWDFEIIDKQN